VACVLKVKGRLSATFYNSLWSNAVFLLAIVTFPFEQSLSSEANSHFRREFRPFMEPKMSLPYSQEF
jgi:hypothetical protein